MEIKHCKIMLTGASGGIGRAIAKQLANQQASLILVGRQQDKLQSLLASLPEPERHQILVADITTAQGQQQVRQFAMQSPRIQALINNAGCNHFKLLSQKSNAELEQEIQLNLLAPIQLCQSAISWLAQPGVMLNIGSTFGSIGYPGYTTYCAAKAGLHRFTEALDRELYGTGLRALYLAPRATDTELNSDAVKQMNQQLGNKVDAPELVARHVIAMLQQETAAKWIGWPEKLFARVNQIFPSLVSNAIEKQQAILAHFLTPEIKPSDPPMTQPMLKPQIQPSARPVDHP